jgi:hypothetical protein
MHGYPASLISQTYHIPALSDGTAAMRHGDALSIVPATTLLAFSPATA